MERTHPSLSSLIDDTVLDEAWAWLCKRRKGYPASSDVWWLRQDWSVEKPRLVHTLSTGRYRFKTLKKMTRSDGEVIKRWSARDVMLLHSVHSQSK